MVVVTLGTGIGTALIYNGVLIPNSELGHLELDGEDYEVMASAAARERSLSVGTNGLGACSVTFPPSRHCCGPTFSWSAEA